jgi:hypothetical protein
MEGRGGGEAPGVADPSEIIIIKSTPENWRRCRHAAQGAAHAGAQVVDVQIAGINILGSIL